MRRWIGKWRLHWSEPGGIRLRASYGPGSAPDRGNGLRLDFINADRMEETVLPLSAHEIAPALGSVGLYVQRELDSLAVADAIEGATRVSPCATQRD